MAELRTNPTQTEILEQRFEDLAGEELSEFNEDYDINADIDKFSDADIFSEIDNYH